MTLDESYCEVHFGSTPERTPEQQLAYAVIERALMDITEPDTTLTLEEAKTSTTFFTSGDYKPFLFMSGLRA